MQKHHVKTFVKTSSDGTSFGKTSLPDLEIPPAQTIVSGTGMPQPVLMENPQVQVTAGILYWKYCRDPRQNPARSQDTGQH